jgi:hypothetical protein
MPNFGVLDGEAPTREQREARERREREAQAERQVATPPMSVADGQALGQALTGVLALVLNEVRALRAEVRALRTSRS